MKIFLLLMLLGIASVQAQQPNVEQILQQTIGECVGNNARILIQLQEAKARIAELQQELVNIKKEKADAK